MSEIEIKPTPDGTLPEEKKELPTEEKPEDKKDDEKVLDDKKPEEEILDEKKEEIPPKPEVDYRKKFSESTRRNQVVESQFQELQKTLGDITKAEVPSDEEMGKLVEDWEFLSDREKNNERKIIVLDRRQNKILDSIGKIATGTENAGKLSRYIDSEPRLKGKEDEFYDFATSPKNQGASMEVLLSAFLYEVKDEEEPIRKEEKPPEQEAPSLERGSPSGGIVAVRKDGKYSDEEIQKIRTTDHRRYNEMVRKGQI